MELNFEDFEMQEWNITTDGASRVDEKNGVICLIIMFTLGLIVIKMSRMTHLLYFLLVTARKISFSSVRKLCGLLGSDPQLERWQPLKI